MDDSRSTVQSVERALSILEALAEASRPMTITDLSERTGLKLSTAHRLLATLIQRKFVMQEPSGKYKLGIKLFHLGHASLYGSDIRDIARPYMRDLVKLTGETANLAILDDGEVVYIDQVESDRLMIVKMFARVGSRGPAHCTGSGKVLWAHLPPERVERLLKKPLAKFTSETITDPQEMKSELSLIRQQGYSLDLGEREEGVNCVAVPLVDHSGSVVAAISLSGPSHRLTLQEIQEKILSVVLETGRSVSRALGYRD